MHSFEPKIASIVGVNKAILLAHFENRVSYAQAHGYDLIEGRYWIRSSSRGLHRIFHYISKSTINRALISLVGEGYLKESNSKDLNVNVHDDANWYTIGEQYIAACSNINILRLEATKGGVPIWDGGCPNLGHIYINNNNKKREKGISNIKPTIDEFIKYGQNLEPEINTEVLKDKYNLWFVVNNFMDGKGNSFSDWQKKVRANLKYIGKKEIVKKITKQDHLSQWG